jgi:PAS domain S-box-containing protein
MAVREQPSDQLLQELTVLRQQVAALQTTVARYQQAEEALHNSETRFRTLVEGSLQGILVHRHHQPLFVNHAFATMLGYTTPEDILRMETVLPLIAPEDRARLMAYGAARLRGEDVPMRYEYQALRQDGRRLWVEVRITMVTWDGVPAMLLTTVDITARKQAEDALARYHLLAAQTQDIILFFRQNGRIVDANQAAVSAYGYDHETLLTMTIHDLRESTTIPLVTSQLAEADARGIRFETVHQRKDGSTFPVEVSSIGAEIGGERLIMSIIRNISARKQAEEALRQSEERFAKAFNASPHLVSISTLAEGRYLAVNDAVLQATGYRRDEMIGHTSTELGIFPARRDVLLHALRDGTIRDLELEVRGKDGRMQTVLLSAELITIDAQPCILTSSKDITAHKQAEAALRRERELLQKIIDTIPVMIAIYQPDTQVLQLNREFERLTGWSTAEARQVDLMARCYPDPAYREEVRAYMESLQPGWQDIQMTTRDGRVIESSWANLQLSDATRIGVGIDITARKQAETMREQLAAIVDSSEDAIIGQTLEGIITSWNRGDERLYGYTVSEVLGQSTTLLCPPDLPNESPQILARLQRGERIVHYETQRQRKNGTRLDVSLTISPIRDSAGRIIGASKIARDITERKWAEAALRVSEEQFRSMADTAPAMLWVTDPTGTCTFLSCGWYEFTGQTEATGLDHGWIDAVHPEDRKASRTAFLAAHIQRQPFQLDYRLRRIDGTYRWAIDAGRPRFAAGGEFLGCVGAVIDITERKLAEEALRTLNSELEQRIEEHTTALRHEMAKRQRLEQETQRARHFAMLGRLAAGVSHEIRNPLAAVFLHTDLLEEEFQQPSPDSPAQIAESFREIKAHLARLDDLVQNYLSLVRVHTIQREVQDLGAAMQAWQVEFQALATARGVTLQVHGTGGSGFSSQYPAPCPPQPGTECARCHAPGRDDHLGGPGVGYPCPTQDTG